MWIGILLVLVVLCSANAENDTDPVINSKDVLDKLISPDCVHSESIVSCLASKAASTLEHSMNRNILLFDDIQLVRNDQKINLRRSKALDSVDRFLRAISDFIDTHTFSVDLTKARSITTNKKEPKAGGGGGGGGGGGAGLFGMSNKGLQKEKRYYQYAFMVLLGIFGLTGPLVMKILGIMAAKSLLAAKAALIIVGSVALKKLFENSNDNKPKVKVTTVPLHGESEEEHDRISYNFNHIPYGYSSYGYYNDPYSAHHPVNTVTDNHDFAPITYGKKSNS